MLLLRFCMSLTTSCSGNVSDSSRTAAVNTSVNQLHTVKDNLVNWILTHNSNMDQHFKTEYLCWIDLTQSMTVI